MREIKFRVWYKNGERFYYDGFLLSLAGEVLNNYGSLGDNQYEVYPVEGDGQTVLQQYTGLLDKNKKEIYEGDLLKYSVNNRIIKIIYLNGGFKCQGGYDLFFYVENQVEIIGNIFQTPELVK